MTFTEIYMFTLVIDLCLADNQHTELLKLITKRSKLGAGICAELSDIAIDISNVIARDHISNEKSNSRNPKPIWYSL